MGYRTVALNQTVHESAIDSGKKKEETSSVVPNPIDVSKLNKKWKGKLHILNRITFFCSNSQKAHTLVQYYI